jgi:hypothetical protein
MIPALWSVPEFDTIVENEGLDVSTVANTVARGLIIGLSQNVTNNPSDGDSATAMLREEEASTDSIRRFFGNEKVSEGSEQRSSAGMDLMKRIAGFIADVARQGQGLIPEDGFALLQEAVEWQRTGGRRFGGKFASDKFLHISLAARLDQTERSLIERYLKLVEQDMSRGFRAFEVEPSTEAGETSEKAIAELRRTVDGLPPYLRKLVTPEQWEVEIQFIRYHFTERVPDRVKPRRAKLIEEFEGNCTRVCDALAHEAIREIHFWTAWIPGIEAEWLRRFSDAVLYNDLPPAMQQVVGQTYQTWLDLTRIQVRYEVNTTRCLAPTLIVFAIIISASIVHTRRTRRTRQTNRHRARDTA